MCSLFTYTFHSLFKLFFFWLCLSFLTFFYIYLSGLPAHSPSLLSSPVIYSHPPKCSTSVSEKKKEKKSLIKVYCSGDSSSHLSLALVLYLPLCNFQCLSCSLFSFTISFPFQHSPSLLFYHSLPSPNHSIIPSLLLSVSPSLADSPSHSHFHQAT